MTSNGKPKGYRYETQVGDETVIIETGKLAFQANAAVTVRMGDTMVFAAATMSDEPREDLDFFPLRVDYEERLYAGGRIPGSFFRREGRPSEEAILTARLVDRPIRPLFPKDLRNDIQVIIYSLSVDDEHPLDILAVNAASAALMISDIPWNGPIAAVRVGRINGEFVVNPTFSQLKESDLDLRIAGTRDAIIMVEAGAREVAEDVMVDALTFGHQALQPLLDLQERMAAEIGKPKAEYKPFVVPEELVAAIGERIADRIVTEVLDPTLRKRERNRAINRLRQEMIETFAALTDDEGAALYTPGQIKAAFEEVLKQVMRRRILETGVRADGRRMDEIRPIWAEVDISPRAHGSGLFTRGETQVLTLCTLGTPREAQELDNLTPTESKRYIHHYNFPPFSTGEVRPLRGASRREIGHGALAERALLPVIPPEEEFPYTLRLVSEVLSSNGSTSMASVCGSTLALMDTGVPIKAPVAGIAMGLIKEGDRYVVLTDILGLEDMLGDMDFKVAGTEQGITALQMDIKISGLTREIMAQALSQARDARLHVLGKMLEVIPEPRPELKPHVPRMITLFIPVDRIGAVIGPGGRVIRALQDETGTKIDIMEDGRVFIAAVDQAGAQEAQRRIEALTEVPEEGRIYTGRVVRITDFGAIVEILPNTSGMVHISQLAPGRVEKVEDVVKVGDEIQVMVTKIDPSSGKIRLSRQAVIEGWTLEEAQANDRGISGRGGGRSSGRGGRGGDRRGGSSRR
ncbi:MAG: polyribonucleotide nucleotidyltransferase, partial [Chloroflexi bacterium]|nr:polyribonucleotide nucleotidyltransferase [Chloroflexota bacterium]